MTGSFNTPQQLNPLPQNPQFSPQQPQFQSNPGFNYGLQNAHSNFGIGTSINQNFMNQPSQQQSNGFSFANGNAQMQGTSLGGFNTQVGQPAFGGGQGGFFGNNNASGGFSVNQNPNQGFSNTFNKGLQQSSIPSIFPNQNSGPNYGSSFPTNKNPSGDLNKKFLPQRSKNIKLDNKHLVKSITILDQNTGYCLKELRIKHLCQSQTVNGISNALSSGFPPTSSFGFGFNQTQKQQQPLLTGGFGGNNPFGGTQSNGPFGNNNFTPSNNNSTGFNLGFSKNQTAFGSSQPSAFSLGQQKQSPFNSTSNNFAFGTGTPAFGSSNSPTYSSTNATIFNPSQSNNNSINTNWSISQPKFTNPQSFSNNTNQPFSINQPQPQSGMSIFPPLLANPAKTPQINNAALTLAASALGPQSNPLFNSLSSALAGVQANQQLYNTGNLFGTQPNTGNGLMQGHQMGSDYQNMIVSALLNADLFKSIVNSYRNEHFDRIEAEAKKKKTASQRLFHFGQEQIENEQNLFNSKSQKKDSKSEKPAHLYQRPYMFSEIKVETTPASFQKISERVRQVKASKPQRSIQSSLQILKKGPLDHFQESYDKYQKQVLKQITVKLEDLPVNDAGFRFFPNLDKLSTMTAQQLKRVNKFCIENEYGRIRFRQAVNLLKKKLSECVEICQDSIEIKDQQWEGVPCQMYFKNFGNYTTASEIDRRKIERKMRKWAQKNRMQIINFDQVTGDVTLEID